MGWSLRSSATLSSTGRDAAVSVAELVANSTPRRITGSFGHPFSSTWTPRAVSGQRSAESGTPSPSESGGGGGGGGGRGGGGGGGGVWATGMGAAFPSPKLNTKPRFNRMSPASDSPCGLLGQSMRYFSSGRNWNTKLSLPASSMTPRPTCAIGPDQSSLPLKLFCRYPPPRLMYGEMLL